MSLRFIDSKHLAGDGEMFSLERDLMICVCSISETHRKERERIDSYKLSSDLDVQFVMCAHTYRHMKYNIFKKVR